MIKLFDHPGKIISWITLIGMIMVGSYTAVNTTKQVDANDKRIYNVEEYVYEQRKSNEIMQKLQERQVQQTYLQQQQQQWQQQQTIYNPPRQQPQYIPQIPNYPPQRTYYPNQPVSRYEEPSDRYYDYRDYEGGTF